MPHLVIDQREIENHQILKTPVHVRNALFEHRRFRETGADRRFDRSLLAASHQFERQASQLQHASELRRAGR